MAKFEFSEDEMSMIENALTLYSAAIQLISVNENESESSVDVMFMPAEIEALKDRVHSMCGGEIETQQ